MSPLDFLAVVLPTRDMGSIARQSLVQQKRSTSMFKTLKIFTPK